MVVGFSELVGVAALLLGLVARLPASVIVVVNVVSSELVSTFLSSPTSLGDSVIVGYAVFVGHADKLGNRLGDGDIVGVGSSASPKLFHH